MGGLLSRSGVKDFSEMFEEETEQKWEEVPSTPSGLKVVHHSFDPRSPSNEIPRTPIQLPEAAEPMQDPRSPTVGIMRTPIVTKPGHHSQQDIEVEADVEVLPPSDDPAEDGEPDQEEESSEDGAPEELKLSVERHTPTPPDSEDSLVEEPGSSEPSSAPVHQVSVSPSTKLEALQAESRDPEPAKPVARTKPTEKSSIPVAKKNTKKNKPRELFPIYSDGSQQRSPVQSRSPIKQRDLNVDVNSPRNILQRKQVSRLRQGQGEKVPMKSLVRHSSPEYQQLLKDKEN